jgi:hypothetical protein
MSTLGGVSGVPTAGDGGAGIGAVALSNARPLRWRIPGWCALLPSCCKCCQSHGLAPSVDSLTLAIETNAARATKACLALLALTADD